MPPKKKIKKPKIRTDTTPVRQPKSKPKCPMHEVTMVFHPELGRWECPVKGCKLAAFPPEVAEKGKPVLGEGQLELVLVKDPDGNKRPRTLLRTVEQNIMIDVTDYVVNVEIEQDDVPVRTMSDPLSDVTVIPGMQSHVDLTLRMFNITDTR